MEVKILTRIRDKLVNEVGVSFNFATFMDPSTSLKVFNDSIDWLGDYRLDDEFVDLLLEKPEIWDKHERIFVDHWKCEFVEYWCFGWKAHPSQRVTSAGAWTTHTPIEDLL